MKHNFKLTICYDGSRYYGWEHQPDRDTVQGRIEEAISRVFKIPLSSFEVFGAGRTDAGVSALAMTCSVVLDTEIGENGIRNLLNKALPADISVTSVTIASDRFHARYNAVGKTYRYTLSDGPLKPVFDRKYVTLLEEGILDTDAMKRAASFMKGEHDFKSFCGNSHFKKNSVRIVDRIEIRRSGSLLTITYHGTGFLQNMVRIMTGTLIEVGYHRMSPEDIPEIIEARDRKLAGPTAPAKGLMLISVDY